MTNTNDDQRKKQTYVSVKPQKMYPVNTCLPVKNLFYSDSVVITDQLNLACKNIAVNYIFSFQDLCMNLSSFRFFATVHSLALSHCCLYELLFVVIFSIVRRQVDLEGWPLHRLTLALIKYNETLPSV